MGNTVAIVKLHAHASAPFGSLSNSVDGQEGSLVELLV